MGSRAFGIADRVWMVYDYDGLDDVWSWELVLVTDGRGAHLWDRPASWSVISSGVVAYQKVGPSLFVVHYSRPNADGWTFIDLSTNSRDYLQTDLKSEGALGTHLSHLGISPTIRWQNAPKLYKCTVGEFSSVILGVVAIVLLTVWLFCCRAKNRSNVRIADHVAA